MTHFENNLTNKLELLKESKDFYDLDFCQKLLYIVY